MEYVQKEDPANVIADITAMLAKRSTISNSILKTFTSPLMVNKVKSVQNANYY